MIFEITIPIDHGNKSIKTANYVFPASYVESRRLPSFGNDVLSYNGEEYTLVPQRMPQKTDKTKDNSYFILTLFAIGMELAHAISRAKYTNPNIVVDVTLLVGLPPLHCKEMGIRFAHYFKEREECIRFEFNHQKFAIRIADVHVFPQAYAAAITALETLGSTRIVNIVDCGGYTVDVLQLVDLRPNMSVCNSLYGGVNKLFDKVNEQARAKGVSEIPDSVIEGLLLNDKQTMEDCSPERIALVRTNAEHFTNDMLARVSQAGLDLAENKTVFVGGGSIMLRDYIKNTGLVTKPVFVDNVHANAQGYQLLYDNRRGI